ncbi:MAG: NUDIX hydrolase [Promethearchaeota archaeon]
MESEHTFNILWEGELQLDRIKWNKKIFQEYRLSRKYNSRIRSNWEQHIRENPDNYDGNLMFLNNFHFKDNFFYLDTSCMKFSTAIYMIKYRIGIKKGIGVLSTQYLVFSQIKDYILIGERSLDQLYFPGVTTCPGGILEVDDLAKSPKEALMREAHEEINLPLQQDAYLSAILVGWNGVSVTFLITTFLSDSYSFSPDEIIHAEAEEWKDDLRWLSVDKLKRVPKNQLLDGLIYYQSKLF